MNLEIFLREYIILYSFKEELNLVEIWLLLRVMMASDVVHRRVYAVCCKILLSFCLIMDWWWPHAQLFDSMVLMVDW